MVYSKEFAKMWDSLPAKIAGETENGGKPQVGFTASDLIFPEISDNAVTITATLKDIQLSRGTSEKDDDGRDLAPANRYMGISSKGTHFKLDTDLGYKAISDFRIIHATDDFNPPKKPDEPEKMNLYSHRVRVVGTALPPLRKK